MMRTIIATTAALGMSVMPVAAQDGEVNLTRAVAIAEKAVGGQVLEAEPEQSGGRLFYEIELLKSDTLHQLTIDARNGKIVSRSSPWLESRWDSWFNAERFSRAVKARPLSQVLLQLEKQTRGTVTEADFNVEAGQAFYNVEIATRAGVTEVNVDAGSGKRLSMTFDD